MPFDRPGTGARRSTGTGAGAGVGVGTDSGVAGAAVGAHDLPAEPDLAPESDLLPDVESGAGAGARVNVNADADADADRNADGDADPEAVARILCLRQLDARARTRAELAAYLIRKGVPPEPAGRVLDRFTQVGLIDDLALAESFVDSRHREAGLARRALTLKLRQRGVADEVIESAVAVVDSEAEWVAARDLVRRKSRSLAALEPQVQARRLVGMLARKGYPSGLAYQVVRERLAEADLPTDLGD